MKKTVLIYFVLFLLAATLSYFNLFNFQAIKNIATDYQYTAIKSKTNKQEINLIYIGSSTCKFCKNKNLHNIVDSAKSIIYEKSKSLEIGFSAVGIAAELNPEKGIDHLKDYGYFNEMIVGNSWNNNGTIKYMGEMGFESSTPQIILTYRTYTEYIHTKIENEKEIANYIGLKNIINWVRKGAPLPSKFINEIQ